MKTFRLLLSVALVAGAAGAADASGLVVRSSGPSAKTFPAGRSLPDKASVSLKPGDVLTVLVSSTTRTLRGPGTFTIAAPLQRTAAAFNPRARFGAMRAGEIPASPSLWHVDVSQSGTFCVPAGQQVQLWRPESEGAATLSLAAPGGGEQKIEWAAGQDSVNWPAKVALAPGAEYRLTLAGSSDTARLSIADIGPLPEDPVAMAKAFIDRGCQSQLDLFVDNTPSE
jgi:hypothetical protein